MTNHPFIRRRAALGAAAGLAALSLSACTGTGTATTASVSSSPPPFATPLATSIQTSQGVWATVAMGHLDDPLNTFWQLFYRPAGSTSWSNQVEATATATNGGLVLADRAGQPLAVGIRPSNDLDFTPIIATANGGKSWTNGLVDAGLAAVPSALAVSASGDALAIITDKPGATEVVTATSGLSSWRPLLTLTALSATPAGRACAPSAFTAVAYIRSSPLLGVACTQAGATGIFVAQGPTQPMPGPHLSGSAAGGRVEVVGLETSPSGVAALLGLSGNARNSLVAAWTTNGTNWDSSASLPVPDGDRLVSYGPTSTGGLFVLLATPDGSEQLYQIDPTGTGWNQLPAPAPTTATIAYGPRDTAAFAVNDTTLTIFTLGPSDRWTQSQTLHVPIQFGSSS